jgi:pimeloyl-ACP methyl ester carboxylesterase
MHFIVPWTSHEREPTMNTPYASKGFETPIEKGETAFTETLWLIVHGIGDHGPDWFTKAIAHLPEAIQRQCSPLNWGDILNEGVPSRYARGLRWACGAVQQYAAANAWHPQTGMQWGYLLAGLGAPMMERLLDWGGDLLSYAAVRVLAFERIRQRIQQAHAAGQDIVLVGHSLGSVLAFEFVCLHNALPGLKGLITIGSPLDRQPVKGQSLKRTGGKVLVPLPWLNVWGTQDMVCCWKPWHSGEMNLFQPNVQQKVPGQGHGLEGYLAALSWDRPFNTWVPGTSNVQRKI